jgi:alkanesulfonate monooxygenase SsuD/methylene tetrahydromethanopterin reductase-like flavin-dependent oxidoreductase (luciferase family)
MMDGRELSIGIARGNQRTPNQANSPRPVSMLQETAMSMNTLLAGEVMAIDEFPTVRNYFNLPQAGTYRLDMEPPLNIRLYCGGNAPLSMAIGGKYMNGLLFGGRFLSTAKAGRLGPLLNVFNAAATDAGKGDLPKVAEIKLSIDRNHDHARERCRPHAGARLAGLTKLGFTAGQVEELGINVDDLHRLESWIAVHGRGPKVAGLTTDAMLDAMFIAGDPEYCRERLVEVSMLASDFGFEQLMFSELGQNPTESLHLLTQEVLPFL